MLLKLLYCFNHLDLVPATAAHSRYCRPLLKLSSTRTGIADITSLHQKAATRIDGSAFDLPGVTFFPRKRPVESRRATATREATMSFRHMWDGIRLHHQPHQGHDGHGASAAPWLDSPQHSAIDTGDNSAGDGGNGFFSGAEVDAAVPMFNPFNAAFADFHGTADAHQSNMVEIAQHATQIAGFGNNGGNDNAAVGGNVSVLEPASGSGAWLGSGLLHTEANEAGNGGDGYFYGGIIHASLAIY